MNLEDLPTEFKNWIGAITHSDWTGTAVTVLLIVVITAIAAHLVTVLFKRVLKSSKGPLPAVSLFINIGRVSVWVIGICIILQSCFGINVGAAVTALGIGGIAISLGFQGTLSNLIGGLQVIITGLVEPGEKIKVGDNEGVVCDVTWRHTKILTKDGDYVIIPNSVLNSQALIKLNDDGKVNETCAVPNIGAVQVEGTQSHNIFKEEERGQW